MARRYARHDAAGRTRYQELKQLARAQRRVLAGTPGTLKQRQRNGTSYWVREYIRAHGGKDDEHIGTVANVPAARVKAIREEIELARGLAAGSSTLRVLGYQRIERKAAAVLAALFNRGLFAAGLTLVGSHAYGALLNEIGLRPSASFKLPGAETLAVDLLVPGKRAGDLVAVDELGAHAQTVPYLDFLIRQPIDGIVLSPNQVIPVKVPSPERYLIHKLFSSQVRGSSRDKARKDLEQAALLAAATEEETPGALLDAFRSFPAAGKPVVRRGARAAARLLDRKARKRKRP